MVEDVSPNESKIHPSSFIAESVASGAICLSLSRSY